MSSGVVFIFSSSPFVSEVIVSASTLLAVELVSVKLRDRLLLPAHAAPSIAFLLKVFSQTSQVRFYEFLRIGKPESGYPGDCDGILNLPVTFVLARIVIACCRRDSFNVPELEPARSFEAFRQKRSQKNMFPILPKLLCHTCPFSKSVIC
jgi:hypothetical protein